MNDSGQKVALSIFGFFLMSGAFSIIFTAFNEVSYVRSEVFGAISILSAEERVMEFIEENEETRNIRSKRDEGYLLPDLVPLPPRDLVIEGIFLKFSTTYFNQGDGTLELKPDIETKDVVEDIERDISQIIYKKDGSTEQKIVGNFLWHQEHLHYHLSDFIDYDLESLDFPDLESLKGSRIKSTFCIRDISQVRLPFTEVEEDAFYTVCGKELQGVSVGWGDTYYFNYPDQAINIDGLPSGNYRLTFNVNPALKMEELRYKNNISSVDFYLDMEKKEIRDIKENPEHSPEVTHIYLDEPFGGVEK